MPLGLSLGLMRASGTKPALDLNLTSGFLDPRVTFTRSSTATFVGSNGLIQSAAINSPRFDYNPVTLAPKGLLIEEQRTNLVLNSAVFTSTVWAKINASLTTGIDDPAGGSLATTLTATVALGTIQQATVSTAGTYSVSIWIRRRTGTGQVSLRCGDLTLIPITVTSSWVRYTATAVATTTTIRLAVVLNTSGDEVDIWGGQIEAGAFATSYIPTAGASTFTRSADVATMTGTNFSSWYNVSEGSFVASYEASPNTFTTYLAASNGVVAQNSMHMDNDGSGNMRVLYYSGSSAVALLTLGAVGTIGAVSRVATAYKVNDFAASRNGGAVVTDTAGAVPVGVDRLNIGADPSGAAANVTNTHIRSIQYFNTRLSNSELQALTI